MVVTLFRNGREVWNTGFKLYTYGEYTYGIHLGHYIWHPALYRFSRIHRVRAWHQMLRYFWLLRVMEELDRVYSTDNLEQFSKPTLSRGLSVLLPIWGENTGGYQLNTKAIESSECVVGHPARSSTNICQRGTMSQRPGGCKTSGGVSSQPERAGHTLCLISQGDGIHYPAGQSKARLGLPPPGAALAGSLPNPWRG